MPESMHRLSHGAHGAHAPAGTERACDLDLSPVVERVMRKVGGGVTQAEVLSLLQGLLHGEFADARVLVYLPVLLQRRACDCLRSASPAAGAAPEPRV